MQHIELLNTANMTAPEVEELYFSRLRLLDQTLKYSYAEIGVICRRVKLSQLWRQRTDPATGETISSFERWVRVAAPWANSTVFAAMRDVEELTDVPEADLLEIPATNMTTLKQLSTAVRKDPDVLLAAKTMRSEEFVEKIRAEHPMQHIEKKVVLRVSGLDESAYERVVEAFNTAMATKGAKTWAEALEMICEEAADVWRTEAEVEAIISAGVE